jgi:triacylglycerol lipase
MRISGHVLEATVPLQADGRFEATFTASLPRARRGWRIARSRVSCAGLAAEKCCAVLTPPENTRCLAVVLLPVVYSSAAGGAQRLAQCEQVAGLTQFLCRLQQGPGRSHAIRYLACVPRLTEANPAEWALALTTLGWPSGGLVLLPTEPNRILEAFVEGLDRLRWLFAGSFDLLVLNLEPSIARSLQEHLQPKEDRATVQRLLNPDENPCCLLSDRAVETSKHALASVRPARAGLLPRHPVVFCHGMLAFSSLHLRLPEDLNCFKPLGQFLRDRGYRVLFPQVAPTSGVAARARQLREQILRWTSEPVNLIAHSMGGLDARYMTSRLDMAEHVRSLTMIATPHRGTTLVDWFLANYRNRVPLLRAMEALGVNLDGFKDCRPAACQEFNRATPDVPGVRYFSFGGSVPVTHVTPVLRRAWNLLNTVEGPNDGMVSTASAHWGQYLGTIYADHFAQTPDKTFVRPGEDFDALGFYCRLIEDLARRGF